MPSALFRKLESADLDQIFAITECYPKLNWSRSGLQSLLDAHYHRSFGLFKDQNTLESFAFFSTVLDEAELLLIATRQQLLRQGFAQKVLESAIQALSEQGIKTVFLEVRASNQKAIQLYEKFGFKQYGIRKRYYSNQEDASLFRLNLKSP